MSNNNNEVYEKYNDYEMYKSFSDCPKAQRRNQIKILSQLNLIKEHQVASSILKYIRENEKLISKNIADDDIDMLVEIVNKWKKVYGVTDMSNEESSVSEEDSYCAPEKRMKYTREQMKAVVEAYNKGLKRDDCLRKAGFNIITQKEKAFFYNTIQRYKNKEIFTDLYEEHIKQTESIEKVETKTEGKEDKAEVNIDESISKIEKAVEVKTEAKENISESPKIEFKSSEEVTEPNEEKISIDEVISKAREKIEKSSAEITAIEMKIQALRKKEVELENEQKRLQGIIEFCEEVQKNIKKEGN